MSKLSVTSLKQDVSDKIFKNNYTCERCQKWHSAMLIGSWKTVFWCRYSSAASASRRSCSVPTSLNRGYIKPNAAVGKAREANPGLARESCTVVLARQLSFFKKCIWSAILKFLFAEKGKPVISYCLLKLIKPFILIKYHFDEGNITDFSVNKFLS